MRKLFLAGGIIFSVGTVYLLVVFITLLVNALRPGPLVVSHVTFLILVYGPSITIGAVASWACWLHYADDLTEEKANKLVGKGGAGEPTLWSDMAAGNGEKGRKRAG